MKKFIIASALLLSATPVFAQNQENPGDLTVTNTTTGPNQAIFFVQLTTSDGTTPFAKPTECLIPGASAGLYPANYGSYMVFLGSCIQSGGVWSPSDSPTFTQASPSNSPKFNYSPYPYGTYSPPQYSYSITCSNSSSCDITTTTFSQVQLDARKMKEKAK